MWGYSFYGVYLLFAVEKVSLDCYNRTRADLCVFRGSSTLSLFFLNFNLSTLIYLFLYTYLWVSFLIGIQTSRELRFYYNDPSSSELGMYR